MLPCLTPLCIWHVLESIEFHLTFFFVFMYMLSLGIMQKGHPGRWGRIAGGGCERAILLCSVIIIIPLILISTIKTSTI